MSCRSTFIQRTASPEETFAVGVALGRALVGRVSIGLVGPLGAGKTQLVKGVAAGNAPDSPVEVTSPTFTLVNEYAGRLHVYHVDAYRLGGPNDFVALGAEEFLRDDSAVVVEWADRVRDAMGDDCLWIDLLPETALTRVLTFRAMGDLAGACLDTLARTLG